MWSSISFSALRDRVTSLERSFDRAREFFHGSAAPPSPDAIRAEESDPERDDPDPDEDSSDNETRAPAGDSSSCDPEPEEDGDPEPECEVAAGDGITATPSGWLTPRDATVRLVAGLYSELWNGKSVDVAHVDRTLAECPPRENLLLIEDDDHYNLIQKAIILDSAPMIQILLSHGCDTNWANRKFCSRGRPCPHANVGLLHLACYLGRRGMAEILMRWGADRKARRRVCSSRASRCPDECQPEALIRCRTPEKDEILAGRAAREPIFYAVLGDQPDVVRLFVRDESSCAYVSDMHLLHLACRIGAWSCLQYFVQLCPDAVNTPDTDGMPPMLLAFKHGLRYAKLMLDAGCDVSMFNDLWERGANIYHFLFSLLPIGDEDQVALTDILRPIADNQLVDINSKRESSGSSPLHELIQAMNRVPRGDVSHGYLQSYDQALTDAVRFLIQNGADVYAKDLHGAGILSSALSNRNHVTRCVMAVRAEATGGRRDELASQTYGLDNVISVAATLISQMSVRRASTSIPCPVSVVLKTACSAQSDTEDGADPFGPFDVLDQPGVAAKYVQLLTLVVENFDANHTIDGELPPLFYLLSQATLSPDADDYMYVVSSEHCRHLAAFAGVLLDHGARTEYRLPDTDGQTLCYYSCMDVLIYILRKMQSYPHSRTADDLLSLGQLLAVVFRYGAKPFLYNAKFYHGPDVTSVCDIRPSCTCTFLYQYLCFGAMNLQYVNAGDVYYDVLALLADVTCQKLVYLAFQSARLVFTCMHGPVDCECGMCLGFHAMLERYLGAPRSLKQLCRLAIREYVDRLSPERILSLRLPKALGDYVLLVAT